MSSSKQRNLVRATDKAWPFALIATCFVAALLLPAFISASTARPTAPRQTWKFKNVHKPSSKWPQASIAKENLGVGGGEVELDIVSYGERCPKGGNEHILFKWWFNRDISVLHLGDEFQVNMQMKRISSDNLCKGEIAEWTYMFFQDSNSTGTTMGNLNQGVIPPMDEKFFPKGGRGWINGKGNDYATAAVMQVGTSEAYHYGKAPFAFKISGDCHTVDDHRCAGDIAFVYWYELAKDDNGEGGGLKTGRSYSIQTHGGGFLTAVRCGGIKGAGAIHTEASQARQWETFILEERGGGKYAIKTCGGTYLTAVGGGGVRGPGAINTDAKQVQAWEEFGLVDLNNGYYAIRTANGNYLTAMRGGGVGGDDAIHTDAKEVNGWEMFKLIPAR